MNQSASSRREEGREGRHRASAALRSKATAATAPTRRRRWSGTPPLLLLCSRPLGEREAVHPYRCHLRRRKTAPGRIVVVGGDPPRRCLACCRRPCKESVEELPPDVLAHGVALAAGSHYRHRHYSMLLPRLMAGAPIVEACGTKHRPPKLPGNTEARSTILFHTLALRTRLLLMGKLSFLEVSTLENGKQQQDKNNQKIIPNTRPELCTAVAAAEGESFQILRGLEGSLVAGDTFCYDASVMEVGETSVDGDSNLYCGSVLG
nr:hypothetical protein Iba_chr05aCG7210 [Ipomoea batatas]